MTSSDPRSGPTREVVRLELGDAVTVELRDMILAGEVAPGDRLVETDLAARFGTSRGPVRDALAALERTGLVTTKHRRGSFVADVTVDDVDELYSLRTALEELAIRQSAGRVGPDDVQQMRAALADIGSAMIAGDTRAVGEADMRLHRTIVELSGHRRLCAAWEQLADQTLLMMRHLTFSRPEIQGDDGEHGAIIDALDAGETEAAVMALRSHLAEAGQAVRRRFAPAPDPGKPADRG